MTFSVKHLVKFYFFLEIIYCEYNGLHPQCDSKTPSSQLRVTAGIKVVNSAYIMNVSGFRNKCKVWFGIKTMASHMTKHSHNMVSLKPDSLHSQPPHLSSMKHVNAVEVVKNSVIPKIMAWTKNYDKIN